MSSPASSPQAFPYCPSPSPPIHKVSGYVFPPVVVQGSCELRWYPVSTRSG